MNNALDTAAEDRNTPRHRGEDFQVKARRGLTPAEIRELTRLSPFRATLALVRTLALIASAIAVAVTWWSPWSVAIAIVVIAAAQHGLMVLAHEAAHYRLYERRWLNDLLGRLAGMAVGISMFSYRVVHRLHHNHLYEPADPDMALMAGYPRGKAYLLAKLLRDLTGLTAHKNYAYFFGAPAINAETHQRADPLNDTSPRLRRTARRDRWLVAAFPPAVLALSLWGGWWPAYLLLWVLPALTLLQAILRFRAILEHGAVSDTRSVQQASRTNLVPRWLGWALFPHHVNYHIEHHLYPSIPHYNLPQAHHRLHAAGFLETAEVCTVAETVRKVFADRRVPATRPALDAMTE